MELNICELVGGLEVHHGYKGSKWVELAQD
jgi:hypothetical protein